MFGARRLVELEEAMEALETAMEYKSEVISRKSAELQRGAKLGVVHERLAHDIGEAEAKLLLARYFDKVSAQPLSFLQVLESNDTYCLYAVYISCTTHRWCR